MEVNISNYTLFSKDSLSLYIDSLGYDNIADNVIELLNDDLNYQIRSLIQKSYDFMRMCKRKKLVIDDINKSLEVSNIKHLYGYGSHDSTFTLYHEIKEGELYIEADEILDLRTVSEERTHLHIQPNPTPNISSCWLNISADRILRKNQSTSQANDANCAKYLQYLKDSIDGNDKIAFQEICNDIRSNPSISLILLNIIVFLQTEMDICCGNLLKASMILDVVQCIISNQHLFLDIQPHLKLLISIPCKCMLRDLSGTHCDENIDAYVLIHRSSYLACNIARLWANSWNGVQKEFENELSYNLLFESTALTSLYAVLVSHLHLGYNAIRIFTFPRMNSILERLEPILLNGSNDKYAQKLQANQLRGLLLAIFEVFLRYNLQTKSDKSIICPLVYANLYETYSDSLASRIPIVHNCSKSGGLERRGEPTMKIKSCEESSGLKLTILTKPRSNIQRLRVEANKEKIRLKLQEIFDVVRVRSGRDALFVLKLRGRQHLCTFTERRKAQILQRNMAQQHAAVSRYRSYVAKLQNKSNNFKMKKINGILPFDFSNVIL